MNYAAKQLLTVDYGALVAAQQPLAFAWHRDRGALVVKPMTPQGHLEPAMGITDMACLMDAEFTVNEYFHNYGKSRRGAPIRWQAYVHGLPFDHCLLSQRPALNQPAWRVVQYSRRGVAAFVDAESQQPIRKAPQVVITGVMIQALAPVYG